MECQQKCHSTETALLRVQNDLLVALDIPDVTIKKRVYSQVNMDQFVSHMRDTDWNHILVSENAQQAYTSFQDEFRQIYDSCFPVKIIKPGYKTRKPWLPEGIKRAIKEKNRLFKRQKKTNNPEHDKNIEISKLAEQIHIKGLREFGMPFHRRWLKLLIIHLFNH